jgi:hypothetical protein
MSNVIEPDSAATSQVEDEGTRVVSLYKGASNVLLHAALKTEFSALGTVRKELADSMNSKNLAFLFGSGCSSMVDLFGNELGIPTMGPMAREFIQEKKGSRAISKSDRTVLKNSLGIDLDAPEFAVNLESLMEVLHGYRFVLQHSKRKELVEVLPIVDQSIGAVKSYILDVCIRGQKVDPKHSVMSIYERFYRRLTQRDRSLPRPWIFTTNYDLFNEIAMDRLGIPYINGFQGSVERRFNPATFRYTLAEQLDIASRKWSSIDSLIYFAKLHGSISWQSTKEGLFPVVESMPRENEDIDRLLIYPTPAKQNASFASPYSDMFRELQIRVAREQSVLVTLGYSFGDEHVNNVIFQALTIPTFRLVAFIDPNANDVVKRLRSLDDPRIWIIGTEDTSTKWKGHYFVNFVDEFMPSTGEEPANEAIERVLSELLQRGSETIVDFSDEQQK